jgi:NADH-quinone oxidoreductase subunit J
MQDLIFYLTGGLALASGVAAVSRRHPFHTALLLLIVFSTLAALYVLLASPLVALVQVLLYGGAVVILFLFVIMLLQVKGVPEVASSPTTRLGAKLVAAVFFGATAWGICLWDGPGAFPEGGANAGSAAALGHSLLGPGLLPFEAASLLLLVGVIGAVVLARRRLP